MDRLLDDIDLAELGEFELEDPDFFAGLVGRMAEDLGVALQVSGLLAREQAVDEPVVDRTVELLGIPIDPRQGPVALHERTASLFGEVARGPLAYTEAAERAAGMVLSGAAFQLLSNAIRLAEEEGRPTVGNPQLLVSCSTLPSPLYEVVAERLRDFIETERLKPGDRLLPERELAQRLGVSRTSVRQALTALRVMGLIEIRPGAGAYLKRAPAELVSSLAAEVAEAQVDHPMIWEVREAVEVQAARLAARRRTEQDLMAMQEALSAMSRSIEGGGDGVDGDRLFHCCIVDAARNDLLSHLVDDLGDAIDRTSQVSLTSPGRAPRSLKAHEDIFAAISQADETRAAQAMRRHIAESAESVVGRSKPNDSNRG